MDAHKEADFLVLVHFTLYKTWFGKKKKTHTLKSMMMLLDRKRLT